jgi:glycosyltransferase involved in cell wall biosynthesis
MKTRVLWVGEATFLNTGYSVYGREVLSRLYKQPNLEIAELACYANGNDPRTKSIPWKVYPNLPFNEQEKEIYESAGINQFGAWKFESIIRDFKPHVVIDIRDVFMFDFEDRSPARPYFHHIIMPTVDASPQNEQWLDLINRSEGVFTYQDWSHEVLVKEMGGRGNLLGSASPAASDEFKPLDKEECKSRLGLSGKTIIGTVMRNQRRKLYPELFQVFARYLKDTQRDDVYLYCHTSYPDMGWDFPRLLNDCGIASKVLFTYICKECHSVFPARFQDGKTICKYCNKNSAEPSNVQSGLDNKTFANIYNAFDLYVQYANCEGFGMPLAEAAACGIPVIATDYSAMEDILTKLNGYRVPVSKKYVEIETGCERAIPNDEIFLYSLKELLDNPIELQNASISIRKNYLKHYSWDRTAEKWFNAIQLCNVQYYENKWKSPPQIINPSQPNYNLSNSDFAKFLMVNVLGQPERLFTLMHARLERDLNLGYAKEFNQGMYYDESSALFVKPKFGPFNKQIAYEQFCKLRARNNQWEQARNA